MNYAQFLDNLNNNLNNIGDTITQKLNTSIDEANVKINTAIEQAVSQLDMQEPKIDYTIPDNTVQAPGVYLSNGEQITGLAPLQSVNPFEQNSLNGEQVSIEELLEKPIKPKVKLSKED